MNRDVVDFLAKRRSSKPDKLAGPAPSAEDIAHLLAVATRVPDHKKLAPWRFIVFEGEARVRAGEIFAQACVAEDAMAPSAVRLETERGRFLRAPMVLAVISSPKARPGAPEWEQVLSCGALCFNICVTANALGFGTSWITEWIAYSPMVRSALGLGDHEKVAGFIHIGRAAGVEAERERPVVGELVTHF